MKEQLGYLDGLLLASDLLAIRGGSLRMQPCLSPVWDTVIASYSLAQAGLAPDHPALRRAASWLLDKQTSRPGDWSQRNPAAPGGWYFEHRNELYPDVDDTCMALMVLRRARADVPGGDSGRGRAARVDLDAGHAKRRRRLGQLRSRQRQAVAHRRCPSPTTTR